MTASPARLDRLWAALHLSGIWRCGGRRRGELPSDQPLFDAAWYVRQYPEVKVGDPYCHYMDCGRFEGRRPNRMAPASLGIIPRPPLRRTATSVARDVQLIAESRVFDSAWYARKYGVAVEGALWHFVILGVFAGFDPNPVFSCLAYYRANPDVANAAVNALGHYLEYGFNENRSGLVPESWNMDFEVSDVVWRDGTRPERVERTPRLPRTQGPAF